MSYGQGEMMPRLTDKTIWELPPATAGNRIFYDSPNRKGRDWTPGFGVRVTAAGARSFILNYRTKDGTERRLTIGTLPAWDLNAARTEARGLKRRVDAGEDPLADLRAVRGALTVADLSDRFIEEHLPSKRASTRAAYEGLIKRYFRPELGNRKVASITYDDVAKLHRNITTNKGACIANRALTVLSKMFSLAIRWKLRPDNPVKGVERNHEDKRTRYLTADEITRLLKALAEYQHQDVAHAIRLLLLTGARKGEVLSMRWENIDLKARTWTKPGTSTKQKKVYRVPLSDPAIQILRHLYEMNAASDWVFPGRLAGKHLSAIDVDWVHVCKAANIHDAHINDLRHTYASLLARITTTCEGHFRGHFCVVPVLEFEDGHLHPSGEVGRPLRDHLWQGPPVTRNAEIDPGDNDPPPKMTQGGNDPLTPLHHLQQVYERGDKGVSDQHGHVQKKSTNALYRDPSP
jgi:integrase